ncbi:hypothetical protein Rhe02_51970 [Rhizocola hellebori]|uniref:Uncharacterized protein n=1 Tax=Rhizocola hellebori TaxID=1392758 RepID=A0A8J3QCI0_9ACTN|nr:hypothetical protein [Rhizocola hellebori]GIH07130.1 hypothetical protein Rhe02_51970 [Rhizocola hellebori]
MSALLNSLTEAEFLLVNETMPEALGQLDEDGLLELHARVRGARNKYSKLYRREASTRVTEQGARGKAHPKSTRNRQKAEVFEDALARVSRSLAAAARQSATELKTQRLQEARAQRNTAPPKAAGRARPAKKAQRAQPVPASAPAMRKRHASSKAMGTRRQAKRDSR